MTNKDWQKVYDAIKQIRLGYISEVTIDGKSYQVEPFESDTQHADGYCQTVLCKYGKRRTKRIGIATICWKDAGPNPKLYNGPRGDFIPFKNIYGVVNEAN